MWHFVPGHKELINNKNKPIELPDFLPNVTSLFQNKTIMNKWVNFAKFNENYSLGRAQEFAIRRMTFMNSIDQHDISDEAILHQLNETEPDVLTSLAKVSATNLDSTIPPKSLKQHSKLSANDKDIWDRSYMEEYLGLHNTTHTWDYITEEEYQNLAHVLGKPLPTMAISKIKTDENGKPLRAKYRIVALGNLDPHSWTKADCFAPVMSSLELRFLFGLCTQMKRIPKGGDFIQAFCQSFLPDDEKYVCTPPPGCPITPPKTYLLLIKTLYGLKRSPRHWYETAVAGLESIGLKSLPNSPCIFTGTLIPGQPPIYLGLFVDDVIYFSESDDVEKEFERRMKEETTLGIDFDGPITHFLGLNVDCQQDDNKDVDIFISQPHDTDQLIELAGLADAATCNKPTPYRSGHPVDAVPDLDLSLAEKEKLTAILRRYVGCLNWLSTQTRPDIATITNMIAKYSSNPSPGHIDAAKHVIKYLKGTKNLGIRFSSKDSKPLESFVKFPVDPSKLTPFTDANWGPQDASKPNPHHHEQVDLFKSRSISGFVIWLGGPIHWSSKRQTITARSSTEAEIYAVDECTKCLLHIINLLKDLKLFKRFTNGPIKIHNDNEASVKWSHNMTTKGLRFIQMRENAIRESTQKGLIYVVHLAGTKNPSDMFTKEDKDTNHFIQCRDSLMSTPISPK